MRDADSGEILWESGEWDSEKLSGDEHEAFIPAKVLDLRSVLREINFTSKEKIKELRLEQRFIYKGECIENWVFHFGFVIKGSTNSWQHSVVAAPKECMRTAEELTGETVVETLFFDGKDVISKNCVRIHYV
eukprot:CAMPEP_0171452348 /NCGR_PEP_ID=MMETSP0945-20130129/494_1 /TAXON_ID=109269 /ORGANISM="Vaucheria litorea, Strain CCMP2940" /LENGTH=131 /DNA_ID=CAMNT_0011977001 /DNA_START=345 /DNA_END=740 /DNA_ORIENTATION=+